MRRTATEATDDIGLWVVIRKSAEALSFNNYFRFINFVLCREPIGETRDFETERFPAKQDRYDRLRHERFLPFTDAEAYRLLKVATEAFVVVNCGVALSTFKFDPNDLDYVLRRIGKSVELDSLWTRYLSDVNGTPNATLPYLALIRDKLKDVQAQEHNLPCHRRRPARQLLRNTAGQAHESLPARADLVVLARGGHARADGERHHAAVPERPRAAGQRPAGQSRDRSAAAAQQPLLGLHPGRAAPAERHAPELRVRPPLRPAAGRQGGANSADRRTPARSSSRPSTTCCTCAPSSSSRTTTRR